MKSLEKKVAVITGAASGIGRSLALGLVKEGCFLALADHNKKGLDETVRMVKEAGGAAMSQVIDVANRSQVERFAAAVIKKYKQADIIVNNAGVTLFGRLEDVSYREIEWIMGINLWGVVYGTRAFLPHLKNRPEAWVVNLSSAFGLIGVPSQTTYCATKFAVRGFTEALQRELKGAKVTAISVHPGGIKTNIAHNAKFASRFGKDAGKKFAKSFDRIARTSADDAANAIIGAIKKKKRRILIGSDAKLIDIVQRLFPTSYGKIMDLLYG
ncbi:MAG TPA: SDR family NAD(P)-dependent oxidoreductase [Spirochaetota bacterium]|nr:SDR family NAD(P)-dependent oxidoreductase [Spirochaetota bacterium]